ncbi:hypothetical protein RY831_01625 [Noviherbaspirillum sp. CPCC 100848]|uniref:Uncharacterized protein n=1 Tax=Noviherbaspirillum album TaxID=3080276 RepID=A0ABU6J3E7_9BURK|nr:hypothetical protein [Noviherbaspirillum sp. CPCC 100848]MEC4717837.1 hypothetical protein [Noviherbaspirillum sp. CPCC 100848]
MNPNGTEYRSRDLLVLKETIREELARVSNILSRLQYRRQQQVAPDLSKDELLEIFQEEHERLIRQLQAIDASLLEAEGGTAPGLLEEHRKIERWRHTLAAKSQTPMMH